MAKRQGSRLARLERLEEIQQQTLQRVHVAVYDVETRQPLNGEIPANAVAVIWIPYNEREALNGNE